MIDCALREAVKDSKIKWKHYTLIKTLTEGDITEEVEIDITGNVIDSVERRGSSIKVETDVEAKEFILSTNEGQLSP